MIKVSSPDYLFQTGRIGLIRLDDFKGRFKRTSTWQKPTLGSVEFSFVSIVNSCAEGVKLSVPGSFLAIFTDLELIRLRDSRQFRVPRFLHDLTISQTDLDKRTYEINLGPMPLLRVLVLDEAGRPKRDRTVSCSGKSGEFHLTTDEKGEIFLLGSSDEYTLELSAMESQSSDKLQISII